MRDCNSTVVAQLKAEMLANNCTDVQPILCVVNINANECFNSDSKEGYTYYTIGGNHSRKALEELLEENPNLSFKRQYSSRLCAIYKPMEATLIRRLASKHNRAAAYHHDMNTWDWVSYIFFILNACRKNVAWLFFCVSGPTYLVEV